MDANSRLSPVLDTPALFFVLRAACSAMPAANAGGSCFFHGMAQQVLFFKYNTKERIFLSKRKKTPEKPSVQRCSSKVIWESFLRRSIGASEGRVGQCDDKDRTHGNGAKPFGIRVDNADARAEQKRACAQALLRKMVHRPCFRCNNTFLMKNHVAAK
jgi:hypothetical protein